MGWLAAIIAIVAITLFAIVYPGFRKFLLILFAAVVALGVGLYLYFENESRQSQKRELIARSLIQNSEVEFQKLVMTNDYGSWRIKGLVKNNSRYTIEKIGLTVAVSNCDGDGRNCLVVGTDNGVHGYSLDIPPGQARALDAFVTLRNLPPLAKWNWTYQISYIQAKQ
jgi:predicted membrane-bound spermidine synthase